MSFSHKFFGKMEKTYDNGVRIGGIENHKEIEKRIDKTRQL